jgi:hypothetical protein
MKLLLDDKQHRGCALNANEACIFAAVLKCTRAGRGWYGNYRELAAAMPFVMSHETARRAVQKLLNLGLIERREEKLFALTQIVTDDAQIVTDDAQNVTEPTQNVTSDAQNELPPNNPPILYNNMNEKEKEQQRALCARDCESQTPSFSDLTTAFGLKGGNMTSTQFEAAKELWRNCSPAKKRKLYEALDSGAHFKPRLDWLISDFPEPQPHFLSGVEQDNCHIACIPLVQVKYNGQFKICSRATMELFGLEWVRDW